MIFWVLEVSLGGFWEDPTPGLSLASPPQGCEQRGLEHSRQSPQKSWHSWGKATDTHSPIPFMAL